MASLNNDGSTFLLLSSRVLRSARLATSLVNGEPGVVSSENLTEYILDASPDP